MAVSRGIGIAEQVGDSEIFVLKVAAPIRQQHPRRCDMRGRTLKDHTKRASPISQCQRFGLGQAGISSGAAAVAQYVPELPLSREVVRA
jgi:hypothetical protein